MNSNLDAENDLATPLPFILPFVVVMVMGLFAPKFDVLLSESTNSELTSQQIEETNQYTAKRNSQMAKHYTWIVVAKVVAVLGVLCVFASTYLKHFPWKISYWGFLIGVIGTVLWIAICKLHLEQSVLQLLGWESWLPRRVGFDPGQIESETGRFFFLSVRFLLLAGLTPIFEELFLRGWLIRYVDNENWWTLSLGQLSLKACIAATLYGVVAHPGEFFAALIWFSLVTFMMKRTQNFWDCVVAHMVTNLLLGIWIVSSGDWFLW